jgi:hypothetical protein
MMQPIGLSLAPTTLSNWVKAHKAGKLGVKYLKI